MPAQRLLNPIRMRQATSGTLDAVHRHTTDSRLHRRVRTSMAEPLHHVHDELVSKSSLQLEQFGTDVSGAGSGSRHTDVLRLASRPGRWPGNAAHWRRSGPASR
jgi:hypothetical protein